MRPRWRKVLHDLTGNLSRTLLVIISIILGLIVVYLSVGIYIAYDVTQDNKFSHWIVFLMVTIFWLPLYVYIRWLT